MPDKISEKSNTDLQTLPKIAGVLSLIFAFTAPIAGIITGIIGIVTNKSTAKNNLAVAGTVISVITLVLYTVIIFSIGTTFFRNIDSLSETCSEKGPGRHRIGTFVSVTCGSDGRVIDVDL